MTIFFTKKLCPMISHSICIGRRQRMRVLHLRDAIHSMFFAPFPISIPMLTGRSKGQDYESGHHRQIAAITITGIANHDSQRFLYDASRFCAKIPQSSWRRILRGPLFYSISLVSLSQSCGVIERALSDRSRNTSGSRIARCLVFGESDREDRPGSKNSKEHGIRAVKSGKLKFHYLWIG